MTQGSQWHLVQQTKTTIATLGHSNLSQQELVGLLATHGLRCVVDVRRRAFSKRHPHFCRDALAPALQRAGVSYRWVEALGCTRHRRAGSPHTAWEEKAFAAYADHMDTDELIAAARELCCVAAQAPTAIMCAEAKPEQCHRRLLSDWLMVNGLDVVHVISQAAGTPHQLSELARVVDGPRLVYDRGQLDLLDGRP